MKKNFQRTRNEDMYKAILQLETLEECMDFFEDICAQTELRSIEQRFEVARMLAQQKVYSDIMSTTSASTMMTFCITPLLLLILVKKLTLFFSLSILCLLGFTFSCQCHDIFLSCISNIKFTGYSAFTHYNYSI